MRYLDAGDRKPSSSLAAWVEEILTDEVTELRWQTGYFYVEGAGLFLPALQRLKSSKGIVHALIGANLGTTLRDDVIWLAREMGIPRKGAALGVVSYAGGLFHPKSYHARRADGSECAYVGSANLTAPGLSGRNIEAGLVLDSREGDSEATLKAIAEGVDKWFSGECEGFYAIAAAADADALRDAGILVDMLPPRSDLPAEASEEATDQDSGSTGVKKKERPFLKPLIRLPRVRSKHKPQSPASHVEPVQGGARLAVPRQGFPNYFLFDATATAPTAGAQALSGSVLPSGAVGLIIQLNRDSARHFEGRGGTANLSIPVATLSTFRFGIYNGKYVRPRAEFALRTRYVRNLGAPITGERLQTAVMAYGYANGEPGHRDIRMLLPADIRELGKNIAQNMHAVPAVNDLALLEWPREDQPDFRLTFLEQTSTLGGTIHGIFAAAKKNQQLVGGNACWLPAALSPAWS